MNKNITIKFPDVRIAYPRLFQPKSIMNSAPKYSVTILLDKENDSAKIAQLRTHVKTIMADNGVKLPPDRIAVKDGDESGKEFAAGCIYIGAHRPESLGRPKILSKSKSPLTDPETSPFYSGCRANVIFELWYQKDFGQRINAGLIGIMFAGDDEPIGGGGCSVNDFADFEGGSPDDFSDDVF